MWSKPKAIANPSILLSKTAFPVTAYRRKVAEPHCRLLHATDKVVSLVDYLGGERVGNALTDAVGIAGKHAIQIFTITGAVINRASQERAY